MPKFMFSVQPPANSLACADSDSDSNATAYFWTNYFWTNTISNASTNHHADTNSHILRGLHLLGPLEHDSNQRQHQRGERYYLYGRGHDFWFDGFDHLKQQRCGHDLGQVIQQ